jgi:hypothetical protein
MTKAKPGVDKNLSNVVEDLDHTAVNSHQANQLQQKRNDRRHWDEINHQHTVDLEHPHS